MEQDQQNTETTKVHPYIERLSLRRNALVGAYTSNESKPEHRTVAASTSVLVDIALAAKLSGKNLSDLVAEAQAVADAEWYLAEPLLRSAS